VKVVALVSDLMDRSRLSGAVSDIEFVADPAATAGAACVVIDLGRYGDAVAEVRRIAPAARLVAFGAHVDDDALAAARGDGADLVLPRSRFFRDPSAAISAVAPEH
jgi:hypothetical protein